MIQAILLIALGFLSASLIGVLIAPALWNRAYRLSRKRLEQTLPITLSEIEAAQDQLRASYAVRMRRLETALASAKQKAAMQLVDNSRLQMQIAALKDQTADLDLKLAERRNAATVLEQTITKRFPELDREIAAVKEQLQERSYELEDLGNKLSRRNEELEAAQRAAASYQEELIRLRQALEKNSTDRSGRRLRRASQWSLDDYRAEYDRLNLELSRLRQQLARLQDRDAQQAGLIKEELQKLAELILVAAQPRTEARAAERPEAALKRAAGREPRRDRPVPWPERLPPNAAQPHSPDGLEGGDQPAHPALAKGSGALPDALKLPSINGGHETGNGTHGTPAAPRSKLLQEAVPVKSHQQSRQAEPAAADADEIAPANGLLEASLNANGSGSEGHGMDEAILGMDAAILAEEASGAGSDEPGEPASGPAALQSQPEPASTVTDGEKVPGKSADTGAAGDPPAAEHGGASQGLTLLERLREVTGET